MRKILLTSVCAIVAATSAMAASSISPFIGINADYTFNNLQKDRYDSFKDDGYEMSRHLFGAGAELGFRMFGDSVYNIGLTGSYDFFGNREIKVTDATATNIDKFTTTYQAAGLSLDNYIRVGGKESGHRSDVILGVGYTHLFAAVDQKYTGGKSAEKINFDSDALSAKLGFQHEFAAGWSWNVMARAFFAGRKYADPSTPQIQNMYTGSVGIKYTF